MFLILVMRFLGISGRNGSVVLFVLYLRGLFFFLHRNEQQLEVSEKVVFSFNS